MFTDLLIFIALTVSWINLMVNGVVIIDQKPAFVYLDMNSGPNQIDITSTTGEESVRREVEIFFQFLDKDDTDNELLTLKVSYSKDSFIPKLWYNSQWIMAASTDRKFKINLVLTKQEMGFKHNLGEKLKFSNSYKNDRIVDGKKNIWKVKLWTDTPNVGFDIQISNQYVPRTTTPATSSTSVSTTPPITVPTRGPSPPPLLPPRSSSPLPSSQRFIKPTRTTNSNTVAAPMYCIVRLMIILVLLT